MPIKIDGFGAVMSLVVLLVLLWGSYELGKRQVLW